MRGNVGPGLSLLVVTLVPYVLPAQTAEDANQTVNRIIDEGFNRSELAETVAYLTDRIGGRLTNSPQMRDAEEWTQQQFRAWGLANVHAEAFEFGRGWIDRERKREARRPARERISCDPRRVDSAVRTAPSARRSWSRRSQRERDFAEWRGKLRGQDRAGHAVRTTGPSRRTRRFAAPDGRRSATSASIGSPTSIPRRTSKGAFASDLRSASSTRFSPTKARVAWVRMSYRDGGLVTARATHIRSARRRSCPASSWPPRTIASSRASPRRMPVPTIEIVSNVQYHDEDTQSLQRHRRHPGPRRQGRLCDGRAPTWTAGSRPMARRTTPRAVRW